MINFVIRNVYVVEIKVNISSNMRILLTCPDKSLDQL